MEDDIDIEEHDVMDNPRIKSIFPDLSCVKMEIPDEEDMEEQYVDPPMDYQPPEMLYQYEYQFETTTEDIPEPSNEEYKDGDDEDAYFFGNEIILGSKPTIDPEVLYEEALTSHPIVFLENWEEKLKNSPCFCGTCNILFSTVNALDAHKMISHSYLVALDTSHKNTARKSTVTSKFCNHCSKTFPDDTSLIKHLYELLPLNNFPKVEEASTSESKFRCEECGQMFPTYNAVKWHKKITHTTRKSDNNSIVKINPKKIRFKPVEVKIEPVEENSEPQVKIEAKEIKPMKKTTKKYKARVPGSLTREGKFFVTSLVPKNTIFQCNICFTGFMSCFSALQHAKLCGKNLDSFKCGICKRKIRRKDGQIHETQHSFSEKLKIYTVYKNIYDKVLCKCPKCLACFDELCFWAHYKICTNASSSYCIDCDINIGTVRYNCHRQKHLDKKLTKKDFIIVEFHDQKVTDEKVQVIDKNVKNIEKKMKFSEKKLKIDLVKENPEDITLYYCEFCGCCQYILSHKGHVNGECKNKIPKRFCDKCGLSFSAKCMERHVKLHENRTFTAKDIKIVNLSTGATIDPPMSELFKCLKCKKHFLFRKQVHRHNCKTEKYIVCKICSKKYNLQAYKVHKLCHSYDKELIPELLKKYNSINNMWDVVYMCGKCDLVSMTYDSAVDHAQNHINKIGMALQNKCGVCDFTIGDKDMKKHKKLHLNNESINRNSFRILKYNNEDLLTNNWLKIFAPLPKQHKQQILSKSIYRYTRNVKLNTIVKAPTDEIKYFCMNCKDFVVGYVIAEHLQKPCEPTNKYVCKVCLVVFNSLKQFVAHEGSHDKIQKRRKFVTFNNVSDKEFNQKLLLYEKKIKNNKKKNIVQKSKLRELLTEGVKKKYKIYKCAKCMACVSLETSMRRHTCISDENKKFCPICEQYFSRKKIAMHMQAHKNKPNVNKDTLTVVYFNDVQKKASNPSDRKVSSPSKSPSKLSATKSVANIFKCDCGLHYTSMKTILKHLDICSPELKISGESCSKCKLIFPTEVLVTHLCNHHSKAKKIVIERFAKLPLYKCSCCSLLFSSTEKLHRHVDKNCDPKSGRTCEDCHLNFHKSCFSTHKCSVKDNVTYVTKISVIKKSAKASINIYRCGLCDISYLSLKAYKYHVVDVNHKVSIQMATCDFCGLKFSHYSWQKHIQIHTRNNDMYRIKINDPVTGNHYIKTGYNIKKEDPVAKIDTNPLPTRSSPRKRKRDSIKLETDAKKAKKDLADVISKVKIEFIPKNSNVDDGTDNDNESIVPDHISNQTIKNETIANTSQEIDNLDTSDIKTELTVKKDGISNKLRARIMVHKYDNRLYRCKYCNQHFMKDSSFDYHVKANNHKEATESFKCDICDLDFSRYTLPRHQYVHHQNMGLNKEDFQIMTESSYSKDLYEKIDNFNAANDSQTSNKINEANKVTNKSNDITKTVCNITEKSSEGSKNVESNDSQNVLKTLRNIIEINDNGSKITKGSEDNTKVSRVISQSPSEIKDICETGSTDNSNKMIDDTKTTSDTSKIIRDISKITSEVTVIANKLNKDDDTKITSELIENISNVTDNANKMDEDSNYIKFARGINDMTPKNIEDSNNYTKNTSKIIQRISEMSEATSEATDNVNKTIEDPSNTNITSEITQRIQEICETTSINSDLTQDSTDNATKISDDNSSDTRITSLSEICDSGSDLTDESNEVTKLIKELTRQSTDNNTKNSNDIRVTSLSEICESSNKMIEDSNEVPEINKIDELDGVEVISDVNNESSEVVNITDNSNDTSNEISLSVSDIETSNENIQTESETDKIYYFKCFDCNVCFINQKMCYEHALKHVVLDPKSYIQCKICDFQFLIDSLKEHMDIHHYTDFKVENLTIQEYKPLGDGVQPKIDTYRAMDKVQSRLISTTTDVGVV